MKREFQRLSTHAWSLLGSRTGIVTATVILNLILRMGSSIILSRLLNAEAYGAMGVMLSVLMVVGMLSDIGIAAFTIRHEHGEDKNFLDQIWSIRLVRAFVLTAISIAIAQPAANFMGKPDLSWAIACGGAVFMIEGLSSLASATALRSQKILALSIMDISCSAFQLLASVVLAYYLRSYWALVAGSLASQCLRVALSYLLFEGSLRRWNWNWQRAKELTIFARYITGSTMLTLLVSQSDKVIMGRLFSLHEFGIYVLAGSLAAAFTPLAWAYVQRVVYPKYAQIWRERPEDLKASFYGIRRLQTIAYMFMLGGFIGAAHFVVKLVYDPRYVSAGTILELLAIAPLFLVNNNATNDVMIAQGKSSFTFWTNIVRVAWLASAGIAAYYSFGVYGVVAVVGMVEIPAQIYGWYRLGRIGFLNWRHEIEFLAVAAAGFAMGSLADLVLSPLIK